MMEPVGPVRQPCARVDFIPQSGNKNLTTVVLLCRINKLRKKKLIFDCRLCRIVAIKLTTRPSWDRGDFCRPRGSQRYVVYLGPSYMSPNARGEGGGERGLSQWVQLCIWSPNELWGSKSINLLADHSISHTHFSVIHQWLTWAGIFKESMGTRNRGGIGLSYRPARLHRLAELIPWNRFRGPINV